MIADTVAYLRSEGRWVFCSTRERFFDGFWHDGAYALDVVRAAHAGRRRGRRPVRHERWHVPSGIARVVTAVAEGTDARIGIHCQDDTGCGGQHDNPPLEAGATNAQYTAERLQRTARERGSVSAVCQPSVQLNRGSPAERMADMHRVAHALAEIANLPPDTTSPMQGQCSSRIRPGCMPVHRA